MMNNKIISKLQLKRVVTMFALVISLVYSQNLMDKFGNATEADTVILDSLYK